MRRHIMSSSSSGRVVLEALRRSWIIALVCVVAAVGVAVAVSLDSSTRHEGRATINVDAVSITQNARLPKVDDLIAYAQSSGLASELGEEFGVSTDTMLADLNAFSLGNPQDRIVVTFVSEDQGQATDVTRAAANATLDKGFELADPVIAHQQKVIDESEETLEVLEPLIEESPSARYPVWTVRRSLYVDEYNLSFIETMFAYDDGVSVTTTTRQALMTQAAVGGLIVGLVLAVVVVAAREVWVRKRA
jgi:hypothetical protein